MALGLDLDAMGDLLGEGKPHSLASAKTLCEGGESSSTSFQSLSTSGTPIQMFADYISSEYADAYIQAVFDGTTTDYGKGNSDFSAVGPLGQKNVSGSFQSQVSQKPSLHDKNLFEISPLNTGYRAGPTVGCLFLR